MKINELNKLDQLEEGPVWDKVKQLGAGAKGFVQGGATGARAGYNAQGTANQTSGKIKDISMLVLNKWQEFNQAYKMANGGQDAGAEEAVAWFIKFTGGQKPNNPNPPIGDSPAYIQKWLQQEIANTIAQRSMAKVQGDLPDISGLNRQELLQLKQQLMATALNEDILNEVDWSKVKNAVAGGAISLAALGLPGLANADAQKMTPAEIRAWVQQSVKNKTPLQAQQIVNKLNVAPTADTPAAATPAPTTSPAPVKAEPAPPTVDPSVARKAVSTLPPGGASKPAPVAKPTPAPVAKAEPKAEPAPVAKPEPKAEPAPVAKAEPVKSKVPGAIYQNDKWLAKFSKDAMTDKSACTIYYEPDPKHIQIGYKEDGTGSLYVSYYARGGIKGYQYRLDSDPATEQQLPTNMEKELDAAIIPLATIQGHSKFVIQTLTVLNTLKTDTIDLASLKPALAACQAAMK